VLLLVDPHRASAQQRCRRRGGREHRLSQNTFRRWAKALAEAGVLQAERVRKRRARRPIRKGMNRSRALIAFRTMHVEALQWSGVTAGESARAHHLSVESLRHWRKQLDDDPAGLDWRQKLHPSARPAPKLSSELTSGRSRYLFRQMDAVAGQPVTASSPGPSDPRIVTGWPSAPAPARRSAGAGS
jgi:hypothetical protein